MVADSANAKADGQGTTKRASALTRVPKLPAAMAMTRSPGEKRATPAPTLATTPLHFAPQHPGRAGIGIEGTQHVAKIQARAGDTMSNRPASGAEAVNSSIRRPSSEPRFLRPRR